MTIIPDENKLIWHFYCKKCLRSWRKRGLENEGFSEDEINKIILREYPWFRFLNEWETLITNNNKNFLISLEFINHYIDYIY